MPTAARQTNVGVSKSNESANGGTPARYSKKLPVPVVVKQYAGFTLLSSERD